jgi:hypothetical protein
MLKARNDDPNFQRRRIWDTGPWLRVVKPVAPALADGQDPNGVEHRIAMEQYERDYRAYFVAELEFQRERAEWEKMNGAGAVATEIDAWHVNAGDSLQRDPKRYHAELPEGYRAGPRSGVSRIVLG